MSKVISLRLKDRSVEPLRRVARRLGRKPSEAAALLLDEMLRQCEFAFVEFRDSTAGRQAFLHSSRLKVWQVVAVARDFGGNIGKTAEHLSIPERHVLAAMNYAKAFPEEIELAIYDNEQ